MSLENYMVGKEKILDIKSEAITPDTLLCFFCLNSGEIILFMDPSFGIFCLYLFYPSLCLL